MQRLYIGVFITVLVLSELYCVIGLYFVHMTNPVSSRNRVCLAKDCRDRNSKFGRMTKSLLYHVRLISYDSHVDCTPHASRLLSGKRSAERSRRSPPAALAPLYPLPASGEQRRAGVPPVEATAGEGT